MDLRNLGSKFSLFVVLSAALHIAAAAAIFTLAPERKPPPEERAYIVRIVPPEPIPAEAEEKPTTPPPPVKAAPPRPRAPEKVARAPVARPEARPLERKEAGPPEGPPEGVPEREALAEGKAAPAGPPAGPAPAPGGAGKERLFDPDVLAGVIGKREPKKPESGITFDTKEIRYYGYMRKLKERIEAVWEYPREALEKGIYGDLVIKFVIRKDGTLGSVELVRTSGWKMLDQAAMEALKDGSPYWPLPEDWGAESFTVTGHFIYSISGLYYVR